jgi:tetratricopeptide (TPR) repeat protein
VSYNKIGQFLLERGDVAGALGAHESALKIAQKLAASDAENADWQHDLAGTQSWFGDVLQRNGNREQAFTKYRAALAIDEKLVADNPRQGIYKFALAGSLERIGDVQLAMGRVEAALDNYRRKRDILAKLVAGDPESAEWQRDLLIAHVKVGDDLKAGGAPAMEVRDSYLKALGIAENMQEKKRLDPADAWMIPNLQVRAAE